MQSHFAQFQNMKPIPVGDISFGSQDQDSDSSRLAAKRSQLRASAGGVSLVGKNDSAALISALVNGRGQDVWQLAGICC